MKRIVIVFLFSVLFGCSVNDEAESMKNVIKGYISALSKSYKTGKIDELQKFATEKEFRKIDIVILHNKEKGWYLDSMPGLFSVEKIDRLAEDKAKVVTSEEWFYEYKSVKTNETVVDMKTERYKMEYKLIKLNGLWFVDEVAFLK